jgi:formylmethanofuran dehydrogenase subunit C
MSGKKQKGIISLLVLISIGFFALAAAISISLNVFNELSKDRDTIFGDLAFHSSESAAKEGVYQYRENTSYSGGTPKLINKALTGDISVDCETFDWPYIEIAGSAENKISQRTNIYTLTLFPEALAFNYAVFSQSELNFKGNVTINGDIFANENREFQGSGAEVNGDAYSPEGIEGGENNINGEINTNVEPIPPPQINLEDYYEIAQNQGIIFNNASETENYINNQIREDIVYIEDLNGTKLQGENTQFFGCLIVEGDLDLTGGTYTKTENYPAIIVQGNLRIAGGATINGAVYVMGQTSFGGGTNTINGSLISVGNVKTELTGNTIINFDPDLVPNWEDLPGLDPISTGKPKILNWREE